MNEDDIWLRLELDEYLRGPPSPRGLLPLLLVAPGLAVLVLGLPFIESHVDGASSPLSAKVGDQEHVSDDAECPWVRGSLFSHEDRGQEACEACAAITRSRC